MKPTRMKSKMSSYDGVGCIPILIIVLLACVFLIGESVGSKTQLLNDYEKRFFT
jgi:hypothetical protein